MPIFHARTPDASSDAIGWSLERLQAALRKLCERTPAGEDFERFEREAHALFVEAEREALSGELERLDVDLPYDSIEGGTHHRVLRSSETYTSAVGPLKVMLSAEVSVALSQRPDLQVVKNADGAKNNWTYLAQLVPDGEERVDFYHAVEQLKTAFDAAYGKSNPKGKAQLGKNRHVLREDLDGVEKVIRALLYLRSKYPRRKRIGEVLGYFRRHRHRMNYAEAASRALPIGSGVVEAACKTLAT